MGQIAGRWWQDKDHQSLAASIVALLGLIGGIDPLYRDWYVPKGSPEASRRHRFATDQPVERVIEIATPHPDLPRNEGAFMFDLWNGRDGTQSSRLDVTSLLFLPGGAVPGKVLLDVPESLSMSSVRATFLALIDAFAPDVGGLAESTLLNELSRDRAAGPIIYLSRERYELGRAAPGIDVEEIDDRGWLLQAVGWESIVGSEPLDRAVRRLNDSFHRIGPSSP